MWYLIVAVPDHCLYFYFLHLMETAKQKHSVDTHKAEKGKWDRMPKSCLDH